LWFLQARSSPRVPAHCSLRRYIEASVTEAITADDDRNATGAQRGRRSTSTRPRRFAPPPSTRETQWRVPHVARLLGGEGYPHADGRSSDRSARRAGAASAPASGIAAASGLPHSC